MQSDRFFGTTRGKIVASLRRRHSASALDLAQEFGLSSNAIRQHLAALESDGFVRERSARRGKTKPTREFALTANASGLFPQQYDRLLSAVLREIEQTGGSAAVDAVFAGMAKRSAQKLRVRLEGKTGAERVEAMTSALREQGVDAEFTHDGEGYVIVEHACPYANTVADHPQVCSVIHTVLGEVFPEGSKQTESLATGGEACRFEVKA